MEKLRVFPFYSPILEWCPTAPCRVSFNDSEGIEHAVEVVSASLYEAAVLAMAEFRRCGFADATVRPSDPAHRAGESPGGGTHCRGGEDSLVAEWRREESERTGTEESAEAGARRLTWGRRGR